MEYVLIGIGIVVLLLLAVVGFVLPRRRGAVLPPPPVPPADRTVDEGAASGTATLPEARPPPEPSAAPELEVPEPPAGRLVRLRSRLARSQSTLGRGLLSLLSREQLDEDVWEEVEDLMLSADVGVAATQEIVERLRTRTKVLGTRSEGELRALLADELVAALEPDMDRTLHALPH